MGWYLEEKEPTPGESGQRAFSVEDGASILSALTEPLSGGCLEQQRR